MLPERVETASFLTKEERIWAIQRLEIDEGGRFR